MVTRRSFHHLFRPFGAHGIFPASIPRALPGAIILSPFRAKAAKFPREVALSNSVTLKLPMCQRVRDPEHNPDKKPYRVFGSPASPSRAAKPSAGSAVDSVSAPTGRRYVDPTLAPPRWGRRCALQPITHGAAPGIGLLGKRSRLTAVFAPK